MHLLPSVISNLSKVLVLDLTQNQIQKMIVNTRKNLARIRLVIVRQFNKQHKVLLVYKSIIIYVPGSFIISKSSH